jgi:biotin carboxyl carrier protein
MQHEIEINGRIRQVVVHRAGEGFEVVVDGRARLVLAAQVDPHTLSLLIGESVGTKPDTTTDGVVSDYRRTVLSYEVTLVPDRASPEIVVNVAGPAAPPGRRTTCVPLALNGQRAVAQEAGPRKPVRAPADCLADAGKIVRVLVNIGEAVRARQPLVVVEAMKMENSSARARDRTVARNSRTRGTSVDAGVLLVVVR